MDQLHQRCAGVYVRQLEILSRIEKFDRSDEVANSDRLSHLRTRQKELIRRIQALESGTRFSPNPDGISAKASATSDGRQPSEVQTRVSQILLDKGVNNFYFVRAPPNYYDESLEFRREVLNAASVDHLCKTIVMQNTRAPPEVTDCSDPTLSKYYMVCVQYTARLHAEKLHAFVRALAAEGGHRLSKKQVNMRLVPEELSEEITGFGHNAVAPVGCAVALPLIVSHRIAELRPGLFWLGGGEVDLKLGLEWSEFAAAFRPFVADCTYE